MNLKTNLNLNKLSAEEILDLRMKDLNLSIKNSPVEEYINELDRELRTKEVSFKPHTWISDEWFTPDDTPGFAIPFYLFHSRLIKLEQEQMLEAEGAKRSECLKILRHETGHAITHAYQMYKLPTWKKVFGDFNKPYPLWYTPKINSRDYVTHLNAWYAQAHPIEDFAETFAVWLDPKSRWKKVYADWPAFKKLEYMDRIMSAVKKREPMVKETEEYASITKLKYKVREHYRRKKKFYSVEWAQSFDSELLKVFTNKSSEAEKASSFLMRIKKTVRKNISDILNIPQYTVDQLFRELIIRSIQLNLFVKNDEEETTRKIIVMLTAQVVNLSYSGYYRIPL